MQRLAVLFGCPAAIGAAIFGRDAGICLGGEEGIHRELNLAEHLTRTFGAAAADVRAGFGGDAVVKRRNEKLGAALEPRDGELADGDKQALVFAVEHERFFKAGENGFRDGGRRRRAAVAAAVA